MNLMVGVKKKKWLRSLKVPFDAKKRGVDAWLFLWLEKAPKDPKELKPSRLLGPH